MSSIRSLDSKVAVVTGAASGIGKAIAERMTAEGGFVVAVDVNEAGLTWAKDNPSVTTVTGSVADPDTNARMVELAVQECGRLDFAFLNAGVSTFGSIMDLPLEGLRDSLAVNLTAVALGIRATVPHLPAGGGSIVVTASTSGLGGDVGLWAYNAAKAGAVNLVRSVAGELGLRGIRVNAVCPAATLTGMSDAAFEMQPAMYESVRQRVPLKRWAQPEEVAAAAVWLASDEASFITGVALPVDGGITALSGNFEVPGDVESPQPIPSVR